MDTQKDCCCLILSMTFLIWRCFFLLFHLFLFKKSTNCLKKLKTHTQKNQSCDSTQLMTPLFPLFVLAFLQCCHCGISSSFFFLKNNSFLLLQYWQTLVKKMLISSGHPQHFQVIYFIFFFSFPFHFFFFFFSFFVHLFLLFHFFTLTIQNPRMEKSHWHIRPKQGIELWWFHSNQSIDNKVHLEKWILVHFRNVCFFLFIPSWKISIIIIIQISSEVLLEVGW